MRTISAGGQYKLQATCAVSTYAIPSRVLLIDSTMSTPSNENDDKNTKAGEDKKKLPEMKIPELELKSTIKSAVASANSALSQLEETTDTAMKPIVSRLSGVAKQAKVLAQRGYAGYEHRRQYGPQLVAGSTLLFGGLTGLRRGRFAGAFAALTTGCVTYGIVYNDVDSVFDLPKNE